LLTHEKLADLWLGQPGIDQVISFASGESPWSVARRIRGEKFETALILPNSPRSALEVWLARISQRVGFARPWRNRLLTRTVPVRAGAVRMHKRSRAEITRLIQSGAGVSRFTIRDHHIHEYLQLAAVLGANSEPVPPRLVVSAEEGQAATRKFNLPSNPIFAVNPGAEYGPAKRWPVEKFVAVMREIQQRTNCLWLILGGPADVLIPSDIQASLSLVPAPLNLAGQTTLRELMALLKFSRVLLTNDSGPMHVAAALGTPVVVPFGSTSPELTGPGLPGDPRHHLLSADVPCSPCFLRTCPIDFRCMAAISVESVVEAVRKAAPL
jgi:heptosyltransferase-2